jgi:hypothetical protein
MLAQRRWSYGRLLRGWATLASLTALPHFDAPLERVGDVGDHRLAYERGMIPHQAYDMAEALRVRGPM